MLIVNNSKLLRRCNDFVEAESIRTRLDAAGILAVINGADVHIAFSYFGTALGGVKLEVAPEDYDRAVQLLEEDASKASILGPWICRACKEQNEATFEICWNCKKPRDEDDRQGRGEEQEKQADPTVDPATAGQATATIRDSNPYRPVLLESETADLPATAETDSELDDAVRRAYVGAIVGTVILPPLLNLYSVWLLFFSRAWPAHRDPRYRRRLAITWAFNAVSIALWMSFYWQMGFITP